MQETIKVNQAWIKDEYHGWICLEDKNLREKKLREKELRNHDKKMEEYLKTTEEAIKDGADNTDYEEDKTKMEEDKNALIERFKKIDEEREKKEKEEKEEEQKYEKVRKELLLAIGDLVVIEEGCYKIHSISGTEITYIKGDKFEIIENKNATKSKELKLNVNASDGSFEHQVSVNVNTLARDYFRGGKIREELKEKFCFISSNFYLDNKEIQIVERPVEVKVIKEETVPVEEVKDEEKNEEEEIIEENEKNEISEKTEKVEEEPPKELTEEELAQKKIDEEEAAKRVPEELIDTKKYFRETEETFEIFEDAKIGNILSEFTSGSREFDCILIRPSEASTAQLFDKVLYKQSENPGCSFTCNKEIYLFGFGLYGPFPNSSGVSAFNYKLKIENSSTKESLEVEAKVEDQKEEIFKFFLERPLSIRKGDTVNIAMQSGQGAVYVLESQLGMLIGDDGAQFRLYNHLNNTISSLYYSKPEDL